MAEDTHVKHTAHLAKGAPEYILHIMGVATGGDAGDVSPPPPLPTFVSMRHTACSGETRQQILHRARWADRVEWQPQDALSSDHRPILVDIAVGKRPQRPRRRPRPSLAKADWDKYEHGGTRGHPFKMGHARVQTDVRRRQCAFCEAVELLTSFCSNRARLQIF